MNTVPDDDPEAFLVHDRLVTLVEKLARHDSRIRQHEAGGVHHMRVTLRRLRSLLATFGPLYDEAKVTSLREELKWVAGELGGARDAEVVHDRLRALATTADERELADEVGTEQAPERGDPVAVLDSERYSEVLRHVRAFATDPPWSIEPRPEHELRHRVRREWKRLRRRAAAANEATGAAESRAALHEVRKAAKRLRYAAESLVPSYGDDAARLARRARRIQTDLGDVQDSSVAQQALRELAERPGRSSRGAFLLGLFAGREEGKAHESEARYVEAWTRIDRKKNRRWLK